MNFLEANGRYGDAISIARKLFDETTDYYYLKKICTYSYALRDREGVVGAGLRYLSRYLDLEVYLRVVSVLRESGDFAGLLGILENYSPSDTLAFFRGYISYLMGDTENAYKYLSQCRENFKNLNLFISAYSSILWKLRKIGELQEFMSLITSQSPEVLYLKGLYYRLLGNHREALEVFETLFDGQEFRDEGFLKVYLSLLDENGEFERGDTVAETLLSLYPFSSDAHKSAGIHYYLKGDYRSAFEELLIAKGLVENDHEIHYHLARTLVSLGSYRDALQEINEAIKLNPYQKEYRYYKIYLLLLNQEAQRALREIYLLELSSVKDAYLFYLKAEALKVLGEIKNAKKSYETALSLDSLNLKRYYDLLLFCKENRLNLDFNYYLEKALRVSRNFSDSLFVSNMALEVGETDLAISVFEYLIKSTDSKDPVIYNNLAYALALADRDLERALALVDQALELSPDDVEFLDTKAWILYKMGRLEEAKIFINRAYQMGGESDPTISEHWRVINGKE